MLTNGLHYRKSMENAFRGHQRYDYRANQPKEVVFSSTRNALFVPDDFDPPSRLVTPDFVLEPLGPQHNQRDYAAWTSSIEHILGTPGIVQRGAEHPWPYPMAPEENLGDLVRHAEDFAARRGFTYAVLDPASNDVIGCLYIYPSKDDEHDARVKSWVTAKRAELDPVVWRAVSGWLGAAWPFQNPEYAAPLTRCRYEGSRPSAALLRYFQDFKQAIALSGACLVLPTCWPN